MNHAVNNRALLSAVVVLLASTILLPVSVSNWLGARVLELAVPLSAPFQRLTTAIRGAPAHVDIDSSRVDQLQVAIDRLLVRNSNLEARIVSLNTQLERLQGLQQIDPSFYFITAARVADSVEAGRHQFVVNVGARHGVQKQTLAFHNGFQVVGFVTSVTDRTATITPITSSAIDHVEAYILPPDGDFTRAVACTLTPTDGRSLTGEVGKDRPINVGDRVIFRDAHWTQLRTGPLIGFVTDTRPKDEAPLWLKVTVTPPTDPQSVAIVDLKVPRPDAGDDGSGGDDH